MKIGGEARNVETHGIGETHNAQIIANPAVFRIFYDQIYTQKEYAIVRELLCNAWDAHVKAGTQDTPIDIHMPTLLEPWFQITDYGTGLPKEAVHTLYMDFGNSDKQHTNEFIGGYGMGSKAPYCLTDQFTVTSRYEGRRYTFQAYLREDSSPVCSLIDEAPTDEPNGLSVYVPVPESNSTSERFQEALKKLLPHIPTQPRMNVATVDGSLIEDDSTALDLGPIEAMGVRRLKVHFNSYRNHLIVMGIVPYDFDPSSMLDRNSEHQLIRYWAKEQEEQRGKTGFINLFQSLMGGYGKTFRIEAHMDVGALEHTVSRESLANTQGNAATLEKLLQATALKLYDTIQQQQENAASFYEFIRARAFVPVPLGNLQNIPNQWRNWVRTERIKADHIFDEHDLQIRGMLNRNPFNRRGYTFTKRDPSDPSFMIHSMIMMTADWIVAPTQRYSIHNYAEDRLVPNPENDRKEICLLGDIDKARQLRDQLGLPIEVHEMPLIRKQSQRTAITGATAYDTRANDAIGIQHSCTAEQFVQAIESSQTPASNIVVVLDNLTHTTGLEYLYQHKLLRFQHIDEALQGQAEITGIKIHRKHDRVRKQLMENLKELGCTVIQSDADRDLSVSDHRFVINYPRLRRLQIQAEKETCGIDDVIDSDFMKKHAGPLRPLLDNHTDAYWPLRRTLWSLVGAFRKAEPFVFEPFEQLRRHAKRLPPFRRDGSERKAWPLIARFKDVFGVGALHENAPSVRAIYTQRAVRFCAALDALLTEYPPLQEPFIKSNSSLHGNDPHFKVFLKAFDAFLADQE